MRNKVSFHNVGFLRGRRAAVWAALICLALAAASCRTIQTVEVPVYVHDTTEVTKYVHDSTFIENTVKEYIKGDTVFIERWHTKVNERVVHDTTVVYREVPIEVPTTETVYVEKNLNWFQKTLMVMGVLFAISAIVGVAMFIVGLKKK